MIRDDKELKVSLFKRTGTSFKEAARQSFGDEHFERDLEDWIHSSPNLIGDLLIVGRQVQTSRSERIDLLALDRDGPLSS